jgi:hypothetical protein
MSALSWDGTPLVQKYPPVPVPIARDEYDETLGCMPPVNWKRRNGIESFQLCELAYDDITLTCVWDYGRDKGWKFYGAVNMSQPDIADRVRPLQVAA